MNTTKKYYSICLKTNSFQAESNIFQSDSNPSLPQWNCKTIKGLFSTSKERDLDNQSFFQSKMFQNNVFLNLAPRQLTKWQLAKLLLVIR